MNGNNNQRTDFTTYCEINKIQPIKSSIYHPKPNLNNNALKPINAYQQQQKNPVQLLDNTQSALFTNTNSHDSYYKDGHNKVIQDLRRGKYRIIDSLDLHHNTQAEALARLTHFLEQHVTAGATCVKIIHGKGLNSIDNLPVLKITVQRFLEHHPRVLAYTIGNNTQGGSGVTLVKLKHT